jgi:NAD-dependent dihydropyrimidine dehydrogenase PreA subunit
MALFIDVEVTPEATADRELAAKLAEVCPVDIYATGDDGTLRIVERNLDECVLCRLCIEAAPQGAVTVRKLYDGGAPL